jgi:hypothetical protein
MGSKVVSRTRLDLKDDRRLRSPPILAPPSETLR